MKSNIPPARLPSFSTNKCATSEAKKRVFLSLSICHTLPLPHLPPLHVGQYRSNGSIICLRINTHVTQLSCSYTDSSFITLDRNSTWIVCTETVFLCKSIKCVNKHVLMNKDVICVKERISSSRKFFSYRENLSVFHTLWVNCFNLWLAQKYEVLKFLCRCPVTLRISCGTALWFHKVDFIISVFAGIPKPFSESSYWFCSSTVDLPRNLNYLFVLWIACGYDQSKPVALHCSNVWTLLYINTLK